MVGLLILLALLVPLRLQAEVIKTSVMTKKQGEFVIKRDIFSPFKRDANGMQPPIPQPVQPTPEEVKEKKEEEKKERDLAAEVMSSISYEGFILRSGKGLALMSVNGEFFTVGAGEVVINKITIIKVEPRVLTVEVESRQFDINLKGDNAND